MKVRQPNKPAAPPARQRTGAKTGKQTRTFQSVLSEKADSAGNARSLRKGALGNVIDLNDPKVIQALLAGMVPPALPFGQGQTSANVSASAAIAPAEPPAIAALVQEVAVVAGPPGGSAVEIQFNSRTLEGLRVRVVKEAERISVQFTAATEPVSRLLVANLDGLGDRLKERGYQVGSIKVERTGAGESAEFRTSRDGSGGGGRQQGGQRDGRKR